MLPTRQQISRTSLNLYIMNLDDSSGDDQVRELFSNYGNITSYKVEMIKFVNCSLTMEILLRTRWFDQLLRSAIIIISLTSVY
jgi:RNA recognition motif-containing protein